VGLEDGIQGNDRIVSDPGGAAITPRRRFAIQQWGTRKKGGRGMTKIFTHARYIIGALALAFVVAVAAPAPSLAQQGTPGAGVKEEQLLQQLNRISGRCSIPDQKACTLEQPAGRQWREFHQGTLPWVGGILIIGVVVLLAIYYLVHGTIRIEAGRSGRTMTRFNALDRLVHWTVAVSFVALAITGLNITFGKQFLLPWLGPQTFSAWSEWAKYTHDYVSFAFAIGVVLMALLWIWFNFPSAADMKWLKEGGGLIGKTHPPAWKFNAGQKLLFWFVVVATVAVAYSGYALMFPFYFADIAGMQWAQMVHALVAVLFTTLIIAHIYIGTLGMEGSFEAMGTGDVDVNWAKQHHSLWVEQEQGAASSGAAAHATPAE
jgi:formate dehydrogenase subunit gamma